MKKRAGFAIIELPIVIFILGLILLGLTFYFYLSLGRIIWFFLVAGVLFVIPGATILIALSFREIIEKRNKK